MSLLPTVQTAPPGAPATTQAGSAPWPARIASRLPAPARSLARHARSLCLAAAWAVTRPWARYRMAIGLRPLSECYGWDRGQPVLRYYMAHFLAETAADIRGHCLEFQDDSYASAYGGRAVEKLDILHADATNPRATLVADLTRPNDLPSDTFDCVICTFVLHVIFQVRVAIAELYRIIKPGGVLIVGVPHISMSDPCWHECWRFTPEGLRRLLADAFGSDNVRVRSYGNSLTAAGQLRGLASRDFTRRELHALDDRFPVLVCARARKADGRERGRLADANGQRRSWLS